MEVNCPISSIGLPGTEDVKLVGLIVVVGPNSSGKTQLLHDLNETVCGRRRDFVVASAVTLAPPISFSDYIDLMLSRGTVKVLASGEYQKRSLQYGTDEGSGSFQKKVIENQYNQLRGEVKKYVGSVPGFPFLKEVGGLTCSALFLKNRLTLMDPCPTINHTVEAPTKTLQALYLNKSAKEALCTEISLVFQRAVWVDSTRIKQFVFRAADTISLPSAEDRLEPEVMEKFRTIETEGDGLRSYSAICASLLLEERPLCLIDEPEMCLHPPQAHAMGRFIGNHATDKTCTVVATHSSHVLRGILETNPRAHVIRLSKVKNSFQARNLIPELLEQATSKPRSRSESILEGLFTNGVILCEAEGDRLVYESAYRTLKDKPLDIRFITSEGTGGFSDPLRLYRTLEVRSAVIADIDFLAKDAELRKTLLELGSPEVEVQSISTRACQAIKRVKASTFQIDPLEIQTELQDMSKSPIDLSKDEDIQLQGKLRRLSDRLYRLKKFKEKGVDSVQGAADAGGAGKVDLRTELQDLVQVLHTYGLFLVPVGELESWLPVLMKGQGREDKSRWAVLAAEKIEDVGEREEDVWQFIRSIRVFLQES